MSVFLRRNHHFTAPVNRGPPGISFRSYQETKSVPSLKRLIRFRLV